MYDNLFLTSNAYKSNVRIILKIASNRSNSIKHEFDIEKFDNDSNTFKFYYQTPYGGNLNSVNEINKTFAKLTVPNLELQVVPEKLSLSFIWSLNNDSVDLKIKGVLIKNNDSSNHIFYETNSMLYE